MVLDVGSVSDAQSPSSPTSTPTCPRCRRRSHGSTSSGSSGLLRRRSRRLRAAPDEVCALIAERGIPTIYGNYDYAIARDLDDCGCAYITPHDRELGQQSVEWTLAHTDQRVARTSCATLPFDLRFEVGDASVHLVHGSPRKVNEYLFEDKPDALYERLAAAEDGRRARVRPHPQALGTRVGGVRFVNCGSVGKPKDGDPRGAFASSTPAPATVDVTIERVDYDADAVAAEIARRRPARRVRRQAARRRVTAPLSRRLLAEFLGSAFLAALVIGSGIAAQQLTPDDTGLQLLYNSAATAAGLFAIIIMFGPVSGGHFNPVVSLVDAHFGGLSWRDAFAYIPAQVAGCITGAVVANAMFSLSAISLSTHHRASPAHLLAEVIATLGLLLVIFALVRTGRASTAPAAVGAYIGAAYWFTSSTSFANPAISIGRMFSDTFAGIAPA